MLEGIKKQARVQLQLTLDLDPKSKEFKEVYESKCLKWDSIFNEITDTDHDTPLWEEIHDLNSTLAQICLKLYVNETWIFSQLNSIQ